MANSTLEQEVANLRSTLGEMAPRVLPDGAKIIRLRRQNFQSPAFKKAAYDSIPDRYGDSDRSLSTIEFDGGSKAFIITGRISTGNPYEVGHAAYTGADLRPKLTVVYVYDGSETIQEMRLGAVKAVNQKCWYRLYWPP